jgi:hypothetical protein
MSLPLFAAACSEDDAVTPTACLEGPAKLETALVTAPEPVLVDGTVPISDCLVENQPDGDLVNFGSDAVTVATRLGTEAGGSGAAAIAAAIRAGYLVGAMEKGAEETDGIHAALVDRVRSAATFRIDRSGEGARVHYDAGLEAGRDTG